jgi:hypothetical protein
MKQLIERLFCRLGFHVLVAEDCSVYDNNNQHVVVLIWHRCVRCGWNKLKFIGK